MAGEATCRRAPDRGRRGRSVCESGTSSRERALPERTEGDLIARMIVLATVLGWPTSNSRPRAPEVLVYGEKAHVVRERETFEDLIRVKIVDL